MNRLLYYPAVAAVTLLQSLPLPMVAWLGRCLGDAAWWLDWRHRRRALVNLDIAFGEELPVWKREQIAHEHFRMLGEASLCAVKTSAMERDEVADRLQVVGLGKLQPWIERSQVAGVMIATGHFGNVNMYDFAARDLPWMEFATTCRQNQSVWLERIAARFRRNFRCRFFEEKRDGKALRSFLREGNVVLGLMCDVSPGPAAPAIPFFGYPVATSATPAIYALRHHMPLHAAVCFRTGAGRWRVEIGDQIPTRMNGRGRPVVDILTDLNAYWETCIRRDPTNWCWVQPRWEHTGRSRPRKVAVNHA